LFELGASEEVSPKRKIGSLVSSRSGDVKSLSEDLGRTIREEKATDLCKKEAYIENCSRVIN